MQTSQALRHNMSQPEVWLRGPINGFLPQVMPVAHALLQAREDLERHVPGISPSELWIRPGGAASMGFHLRHLAGSMDRLLTYALGRSLDRTQLQALAVESEPGDPPAEVGALLDHALSTIERTLDTIRSIPEDELFAERRVGRAGLPSTTLGLLFHVGEHTTRHVGQFITTKKVVRGLDLDEPF